MPNPRQRKTKNTPKNTRTKTTQTATTSYAPVIKNVKKDTFVPVYKASQLKTEWEQFCKQNGVSDPYQQCDDCFELLGDFLKKSNIVPSEIVDGLIKKEIEQLPVDEGSQAHKQVAQVLKKLTTSLTNAEIKFLFSLLELGVALGAQLTEFYKKLDTSNKQ